MSSTKYERRIYYVGLEPYESRYTLQLTEWNRRELERLQFPHEIVNGTQLTYELETGAVLDAHGRGYWALSQMRNLISMLYTNQIKKHDIIFFEDMYHPGIEALGYIKSQVADFPKIAVRCLAQTIDPDDFTAKNPRMQKWMRHYENMVAQFVDVICVASEEMLAHISIAQWDKNPDCKIVVTGLPFNSREVIERLGTDVEPFAGRIRRVVFASRWDDEKQLDFYLELARRRRKIEAQENSDNSTEFCILSGIDCKKLPKKMYKKAAIAGVTVMSSLPKESYYSWLSSARVLFNCSLQDWVSNTLSEADCLGCNVLFPAYRSFPEALDNSRENLYIPWSLDDADIKLSSLLRWPAKRYGQFHKKQDKTIEKTFRYLLDPVKNPLPSLQDGYRKRITKEALLCK